jgi:hypothetical protein
VPGGLHSHRYHHWVSGASKLYTVLSRLCRFQGLQKIVSRHCKLRIVSITMPPYARCLHHHAEIADFVAAIVCQINSVYKNTNFNRDLRTAHLNGLSRTKQRRGVQVMKTPPTTYFIKKALGISKGSQRPAHSIIGKITLPHIYEIARVCSQLAPRLLLVTKFSPAYSCLTSHLLLMTDLVHAAHVSFLTHCT